MLLDVSVSMLSGLVLRLVLPGPASTLASTLSLPMVGLWEAAVLHQLSNGFDDILAYCLRLLVDFLATRDAARAILVITWTGVGLLIAQYLRPSTSPRRTHSHRHRQSPKNIRLPHSRSRTITPPLPGSPSLVLQNLPQPSPLLHRSPGLGQQRTPLEEPSPLAPRSPNIPESFPYESRTETDTDRLSPIAEEEEDSPRPVPVPAPNYPPKDPSVILPIPNPLPYPRPASTDPALHDLDILTPTQALVLASIDHSKLSPLNLETVFNLNQTQDLSDVSLASPSDTSVASNVLEKAHRWRFLAKTEIDCYNGLEEARRRALDENRPQDALKLKRHRQAALTKALEYHHKAASRQFKARNPDDDILKSIDVRGLLPHEALEKVEDALLRVIDAGLRMLVVKGLYGRDISAKVKQRIIEGMQEIPYKPDPTNESILILTLPAN